MIIARCCWKQVLKARTRVFLHVSLITKTYAQHDEKCKQMDHMKICVFCILIPTTLKHQVSLSFGRRPWRMLRASWPSCIDRSREGAMTRNWWPRSWMPGWLRMWCLGRTWRDLVGRSLGVYLKWKKTAFLEVFQQRASQALHVLRTKLFPHLGRSLERLAFDFRDPIQTYY